MALQPPDQIPQNPYVGSTFGKNESPGEIGIVADLKKVGQFEVFGTKDLARAEIDLYSVGGSGEKAPVG